MSYITATEETIKDLVASEDRTVLYFTASWCGPCKSFSPIFEEVAAANPDIKFVKIDASELKETAGEFGVRSIPSLILRDGAQTLETKTGAQNKPAFELLLTKFK